MKWLKKVIKRYKRYKSIKRFIRYLENHYSIDIAGVISMRRLYRAYLLEIRHLKNLSKVKT
jgi:hypothetical protein